jgi:hypothetical protein
LLILVLPCYPADSMARDWDSSRRFQSWFCDRPEISVPKIPDALAISEK